MSTNTTTTKAPSAAAAAKAVATFAATQPLTGGHLYRVAALLLALANGFTVTQDGTVDHLFKGGKHVLSAKNGSNGVLTSVVDPAGNAVIKAGTSLRWEGLAQMLTTGKLDPTKVKPVVLTKGQRDQVKAGKAPTM